MKLNKLRTFSETQWESATKNLSANLLVVKLR
jgi:hypothetical protein